MCPAWSPSGNWKLETTQISQCSLQDSGLLFLPCISWMLLLYLDFLFLLIFIDLYIFFSATLPTFPLPFNPLPRFCAFLCTLLSPISLCTGYFIKRTSPLAYSLHSFSPSQLGRKARSAWSSRKVTLFLLECTILSIRRLCVFEWYVSSTDTAPGLGPRGHYKRS